MHCFEDAILIDQAFKRHAFVSSDNNQTAYAVDLTTMQAVAIAFDIRGIHPYFKNLVLAAPHLYHELTNQVAILETTIEMMETLNAPKALMKAMQDMQISGNNILKLARSGVEEVASDIANEKAGLS